MNIITIINQKGGVGKSTTALVFGASLLNKGYKVLFVDMDAQGNLSNTLNADCAGLTGLSVLEMLNGSVSALQAIQKTENGDVIASSPALAAADTVLINVGKEFRLAESLESIQDQYDYVVIDTPPALGILTVNALTAATGCIIPAQADIYSIQGIGQLYKTISTIRKYCNHDLKVYGMLLTRFNPRTIISKDISEMLSDEAEKLGTKVYKSRIRECTALKEAQALHETIYQYAPKSNAAFDYDDFVDEFLEDK